MKRHIQESPQKPMPVSEPQPFRSADFDYHLPKESIAQTPVEPRDHSRLLVLGRKNGSIRHHYFYDLPEFLGPRDLLVFNDSRVIPARLRGRKFATGGKVEILLLRCVEPGAWQALVRPGKRLPPGSAVSLNPGPDGATGADRGQRKAHSVRIGERMDGGTRLVHFEDEAAIEACGLVPLPPYIHQPLSDAERYQTVYARVRGSAAAPTAGLHFTKDLLARLEGRTGGCAFVTLHVGLDTFRPVTEEDPRQHRMHSEFAVLPDETAHRIREAREHGGRVVCVGTTTARVLETAAARNHGAVESFCGWTDLFIFPGHRFSAMDALITNFHLPRSSLLMLVSAFAGKLVMDRAYTEAIVSGYRFYSFGDAMLIV